MEGKESSGLNSSVSTSASLTAFLFPIFIPAKLRSRITSVHWGKGVGKKRLPERKRKDSDPACLSIQLMQIYGQPSEQLGTQAQSPQQHLKMHVYPFTRPMPRHWSDSSAYYCYFFIFSCPPPPLLFLCYTYSQGRGYVPQWTAEVRGQLMRVSPLLLSVEPGT